MNAKVIGVLIFVPISVYAQGFSGLGSSTDGFTTPMPNPEFNFPTDHGPHTDYRVEWWYLTANLTGPDAVPYGLQWTLFRTALSPGAGIGWTTPQLWMGHAAVTTPSAHYVSERLARGGIGQAGVEAMPFSAWIDDWVLEGTFDALEMAATGTEFAYDMSLTADRPLVLHGDRGYSVKSAGGQASYYYSQPFYDIAGTLNLPDGRVDVTGTAWLDREWSTQPLGADQTGWDWFSLSFDDGSKMMGFALHGANDSVYSSATWIAPDGNSTAYPNGEFHAVPLTTHDVAGRTLPVRWQVSLPARGIDVTVEAINPNAWMATSVPYWEGPITFGGSHSGRGYLEMTGYE